MEVASVEGRIEQVTIYASGARIRRVATIPAPLPGRVRIVGLPLSVIDDTVRVEVGGPAVATSLRVGVEAPAASEAAAEDTPELRAARRRVAIAEAELDRIASALELVAQAPIVAEDPSDDPPAAWSAVVAARRGLVALRAERELTLRAQQITARREAEAAQRALEAVADRDLRAGSARPAKLHELRKYVDLELTATAASEIAIHIEYQVAAARWAPSYVARLDGDRVELEVRAVVAQDTGEDWTAVPLRLSTAEPEQFALLPELAPQKIGRRQHEPVRAGFRAPPTGADALYADYDRELRPRREAQTFTSRSAREDSTYEGRPPGAGAATMIASGFAADEALSGEVWDEESAGPKAAFQTPPRGNVMPVAQMRSAAPRPAMFGGAAPSIAPPMMKRRAPSRDEGSHDASAPTPVGSTPRLDYGNLRMAGPSSPARGMLVPAAPDRHAAMIATELAAAQTRLAGLVLPPGYVTSWAHTYDYAFATEGGVDVRADGAWHAIAVTSRATVATLRHVTVPREQADVFRVASVVNSLPAPLLPGPIDIYDRGRFLITSSVDYTPPGATVEIGLGVDAAVKVARNTEFREEAAGMLRGALRLLHAITIDVDNLSGRAIELEVRERIPVKREGDDEVEVLLGKIEPSWEPWTPDPEAPRAQRLRGGYRWRLSVPAGAKRRLEARYELKIAGKQEVVGGNRRES